MIINPPSLHYLSKYNVLEIRIRVSLPLDQQVADTVFFGVPVATVHEADLRDGRVPA